MKIPWTIGLNEDQVKAVEATLANPLFRQQFLKILKDRYETIERKGFREEDYKTPDWTHLQAFNNGRLAALHEIADLLDLR